ELLLSVQHQRTVANDSTVSWEGLRLQLPPRPDRLHYVRCPVLVHEFPEGTLGISYQGRLLARLDGPVGLVSQPNRRLARDVCNQGHRPLLCRRPGRYYSYRRTNRYPPSGASSSTRNRRRPYAVGIAAYQGEPPPPHHLNASIPMLLMRSRTIL